MLPQRERLVRICDESPERLDSLPFGAIVIDFEGQILAYNDHESKLSHLAKRQVLGKNFFRAVAPCTAVGEFEGRMRTFLSEGGSVSETFEYFFPFIHGPADVAITFVRRSDKRTILIVVERLVRQISREMRS